MSASEQLTYNLLVVHYLSGLLGGDAEGLREAMRGADEGRRPDGQSHFYGVLESRRSLLQAPLDLNKLKGFDLNILGFEQTLSKKRSDFRLKYFQYLAALYTEMYLYLLTSDKEKLLQDLERFRAQKFAHLPALLAGDLYKLSFWMATGSGKTLLMHLNLLQVAHYKPIETNNILLITPGDTLTQQHLKDFAASGIPAHYFRDAPPLNTQAVKVIEITKLLPANETRSGGLSVPVTDFEGPNLVLVDEGHKGTTTASDLKEERRWRDVRAALVDGTAGGRGLTLEYSATFAQVTENNDDLFNEYARSIVFDYPYARFHADGYGKDFSIMNLKQEENFFGDTLLLGALLNFYEQYLYVVENKAVAEEYELEKPLMVFVGQYVNAGPEVLQVLEFLDKVLKENAWATTEIGKLLTGKSGLPGPDDRDAFADKFSYLRSLGTKSDELYGHLCQLLFYGDGRLELHDIKNADGEIGLKAANSDSYCGLVYVGEAKKFLDKVQQETDLLVGSDEHLSDSLFDGVAGSASMVNFLVGSKKFTEGWSSWRVSTMGLIKVGSNAGAQVLQLFGRGVRLRGKGSCLRRSEGLPGGHPERLEVAETLGIFGLSANYLKKFLDMLYSEGFDEPPVSRELPIEIREDLLKANLKAIELNDTYDFSKETRIFTAESLEAPVRLSLLPTLEIGGSSKVSPASVKAIDEELNEAVQNLLPMNTLYQHALNYKTQKGWHNLFIPRGEIKTFFTQYARLAAPPEVLTLAHPRALEVLKTASQTMLELGLDSFYLTEQRRAESEQLKQVTLDKTHANFPTVKGKSVYTLKIPKSLLEEVEAIIATKDQLLKETNDEPLPRLHLDTHLYAPLLVQSTRGVKSTPTGLEESEVKFVNNLRAFWRGVHTTADWQDHNLYLLRNLPKKGIGFFQTAGFYPDFLLWLTQGEKQVLAFVDPKGLVQWNEEKVKLLETIAGLSSKVNVPMCAFIATPTKIESIPVQNVEAREKQAYLEKRNIFLQEDKGYIRKIINSIKQRIKT
jgi:hypothetical protein